MLQGTRKHAQIAQLLTECDTIDRLDTTEVAGRTAEETDEEMLHSTLKLAQELSC